MPIRDVNQGTPSLAAQIPFYDPAQGQDRRASVADILALATPAGVDGFVTQRAAPNASGFVVTLTAPDDTTPGVWLLLTPTASFAALTIDLPAGTDGLEIIVSSTQSVTGTLSVVGATVGASPQPVNGAPATLAANGFFRLRFDGVTASWYRIG